MEIERKRVDELLGMLANKDVSKPAEPAVSTWRNRKQRLEAESKAQAIKVWEQAHSHVES